MSSMSSSIVHALRALGMHGARGVLGMASALRLFLAVAAALWRLVIQMSRWEQEQLRDIARPGASRRSSPGAGVHDVADGGGTDLGDLTAILES
jgi:hypothetical protein